jgi:hypothetical protein
MIGLQHALASTTSNHVVVSRLCCRKNGSLSYLKDVAMSCTTLLKVGFVPLASSCMMPLLLLLLLPVLLLQLAHVVFGEDGHSLQPITGSVSSMPTRQACCCSTTQRKQRTTVRSCSRLLAIQCFNLQTAQKLSSCLIILLTTDWCSSM